MFILKKGHQPGVYVPLRALFLVEYICKNKGADQLIGNSTADQHLCFSLQGLYITTD